MTYSIKTPPNPPTHPTKSNSKNLINPNKLTLNQALSSLSISLSLSLSLFRIDPWKKEDFEERMSP